MKDFYVLCVYMPTYGGKLHHFGHIFPPDQLWKIKASSAKEAADGLLARFSSRFAKTVTLHVFDCPPVISHNAGVPIDVDIICER